MNKNEDHRYVSRLKKKVPPPDMCVIDTLFSMTLQLVPEIIDGRDLFFEIEREFERLEDQRKKQMLGLGSVVHDHTVRDGNWFHHLEAAKRLDRIMIQRLYTEFLSSLGNRLGIEFELDFLQSKADSISNYLDTGFAVAVLGARHIFHVDKDENGTFVDKTTLEVNGEDSESWLMNEEGLSSRIEEGIQSALRDHDNIPSSFWNSVVVSRRSSA